MKSTVILVLTLSLVGAAEGVTWLKRHSSFDNSAFPASPKPAGGDQTNPPTYAVQSDFDFQSIRLRILALKKQEYIELDLFHNGLAKFSVQEFEAAGLGAEERFLIEFMAGQEVGHAVALEHLLGPRASKPCNYAYPFTTIPEFIDFCQIVTRFGESGTYGFLPHLDSRPSAQILLQSIPTEARQQMIFRDYVAMPFYFLPSIAQSMQWTLLAPYVTVCPSDNPRIEWTAFPALNITNAPSALNPYLGPALTHNRIQLSSPGQEIHLTWESPGKPIGGFNYTTALNVSEPKFAAWISQFNTTYTPLFDVQENTASTTQPNATSVFPGIDDPQVNGTIFVLLTDQDLFVTPSNLSLLDAHVDAGRAVYQAG